MANQQKIKMIKQIEKHLRNYQTYKIAIVTLKTQLDYIMPNITVDYSVTGGSSGTFNVKSDTEKFAIDRIESKKAVAIHEDMEKYKMIIRSIDEAMKELDEVEQDFIKNRYFKKKTMPQTAIELGYNEKYIFNIRNQIFDKFLISLKGLTHF